MVFKRRDKRPLWRVLLEFFYPKGGWSRAYHYVRHRLRRLPDPPHRIARGMFAGILTSFTPFFGLHFVIAALISRVLNGNIIAGLLATFFGNPITFPFIATLSLNLGHYILGTEHNPDLDYGIMHLFKGAMNDLWFNFVALFTPDVADWSKLRQFYMEVFLPYLVGGIIPGTIAGLVGYYVSVPVISVYQKRRKGRLTAKFEELRQKKAAKKAEKEAEGEIKAELKAMIKAEKTALKSAKLAEDDRGQ
ncbi:MAG: DUF2062 domain-containing protein [Halocynthiibacter sp.]